MGRLIRWVVAVIFVAGVAVFIWQKTRSKPVEVVVQPVERGKVEQTVANTRAGTIEACRRARLSPSIGGQIARLPVQEGDHVEQGALLLEIWNEDLAAQLLLAEREATFAEKQARASCLSAGEAQRQAERAEMLFSRQVGSEEETDRAVTQAASLAAQCEAASASVKMSAARIEAARANLSKSRLIAPFSGVIAKIEGELNEFVTPSPVGIPTPPVVDLIEDNCFYVSAPIDEVDAAAVRIGMIVRISLDAFKDRQFAGTVRRISPYVLDIEKQARTVEIETSFSDSGDFKELLAGYSADVEIIIATRDDTLKIPTEAVLDGKRVFVYLPAEKKIRERTIAAGLANWVSTEVVSGLEEGQSVVINVDKPGLADGAAAVLSEEQP